MTNELDHPCKEVCSGWRQGYENGLAAKDARIAYLESGVHTCHDECDKPLCVKFREKDKRIARLEIALKDSEWSYIGALSDTREAEKKAEDLEAKMEIAVRALKDVRQFLTWLGYDALYIGSDYKMASQSKRVDLDKALAAINAHGNKEEKK